MSEDVAKGAFDLEPDETPAAPAPQRAPRRAPREARGTGLRRREAAAPVVDGAEGSWFWRFVTSPRTYYGLSALMLGVVLFVQFNPWFGMQKNDWFWAAYAHDPYYVYRWNPALVQAIFMPLALLGVLAGTLSAEGEGRGRWIAVWCVLGFVTYQISRAELFLLLPPIATIAALGVLLRTGRGDPARRLTVVVTLLLAAFLLAPKIDRQRKSNTPPTQTMLWSCEAFGLIDLIGDPPGFRDEGYLTRLGKVFVANGPGFVRLASFVLLLLLLFGLRGRWFAWTSGFLLLYMLATTTWVLWDYGTATRGPALGKEWWGGISEIGEAWRARFTAFMPALIGCICEIGRRRSASA